MKHKRKHLSKPRQLGFIYTIVVLATGALNAHSDQAPFSPPIRSKRAEPKSACVKGNLTVSDALLFNLKKKQCCKLSSNPLSAVVSPEKFSCIAASAIGFTATIGEIVSIPGTPDEFVLIEGETDLLDPRAFVVRGCGLTPTNFVLSNLRTVHNSYKDVIYALQGELTITFDECFCKAPHLFLGYENDQLGPFDCLRTTAPYSFNSIVDSAAGIFNVNIFLSSRNVTANSAIIDILYFIHTDVSLLFSLPIANPDANKANLVFFLQKLIKSTVLSIKAQA